MRLMLLSYRIMNAHWAINRLHDDQISRAGAWKMYESLGQNLSTKVKSSKSHVDDTSLPSQ